MRVHVRFLDAGPQSAHLLTTAPCTLLDCAPLGERGETSIGDAAGGLLQEPSSRRGGIQHEPGSTSTGEQSPIPQPSKLQHDGHDGMFEPSTKAPEKRQPRQHAAHAFGPGRYWLQKSLGIDLTRIKAIPLGIGGNGTALSGLQQNRVEEESSQATIPEELDPGPTDPLAPMLVDISLVNLSRCTDAYGRGANVLGPYLPFSLPEGVRIALLVVGRVDWLFNMLALIEGVEKLLEVEYLDEQYTRMGPVQYCDTFLEGEGIHGAPHSYVRALCPLPELATFKEASAVRLIIPGIQCSAARLDNRSADLLESAQNGLEGSRGAATTAVAPTRQLPRGSAVHLNTNASDLDPGDRQGGESARDPDWLSAVPRKQLTGVCLGPVIFRGGDPGYFLQWFAYHVEVLQVDHVYVYLVDSCQKQPLQAAVLAYYQQRGKATVIDWSTIGGTPDAPKGWTYNQPVKDNDCLHRFRYDSKYLMYFDGDEFLYPQGSLYTVPDVIRAWQALDDYPNHHSFRWMNQWRSTKLEGGGDRNPNVTAWESVTAIAQGRSGRLVTRMRLAKKVEPFESHHSLVCVAPWEPVLRGKYVVKAWRAWRAAAHQVGTGDGECGFLDPPLLIQNHYYLMSSRSDHLAEDWVEADAVQEDVAWIDRYALDFEAAARQLATSLLSEGLVHA
eukprot:jgi/Botrbrau1/1117/Bobra.0162s0015.2